MFRYVTGFIIVLYSVLITFGVVSYFQYFKPRISQSSLAHKKAEKDRIRFEYIDKSQSFLISALKKNYYQLKNKDECRFYDCEWKATHVNPKPFYAYPYMCFFESSKSYDIFSGMATINNWPSLLYVRNLTKYNHYHSKVLIGIRGSDYNIAKSNLSWEMLFLTKRNRFFANDLIMMPDNYVFMDPDKQDITCDNVQACCHNRTYKGNRFVSVYWKFFDDGKFWDMYDKLLTNSDGVVNDNVWIFGYSNGSSPTLQLLPDKRSSRIRGMIMIETLYDSVEPIAEHVRKHIYKHPDRYFYATCGSEDCPTGNHYRLIELLRLRPYPIHGGTRYQNKTKNVVIDMLDPEGPLKLSHSSIIPYTMYELEKNNSATVYRSDSANEEKMKKNRVTKTFTITASPTVMHRIERLLAMFHFNSAWGHSSTFGMPLDGDGDERVTVAEVDHSLAKEVNLIGGVGGYLEVALDEGYTCKNMSAMSSYWKTSPPGILYRNDMLYKTRGE